MLTSLWGFRRGARWVWWMLLLSGVPGFGAALGVHLAIGYLELTHVAPALIGATFFGFGIALSYPYLCAASTDSMNVGSLTDARGITPNPGGAWSTTATSMDP